MGLLMRVLESRTRYRSEAHIPTFTWLGFLLDLGPEASRLSTCQIFQQPRTSISELCWSLTCHHSNTGNPSDSERRGRSKTEDNGIGSGNLPMNESNGGRIGILSVMRARYIILACVVWSIELGFRESRGNLLVLLHRLLRVR